MTVKMDRRDLCKVLIAIDAVIQDENASKEYKRIHDELREQLLEWDEKHSK